MAVGSISPPLITLIIIVTILIVGSLIYWLFIATEGTFLGRRMVVWMYDITAHKYDGIKQYDDDAEQFFVIRPLLHKLRNEPAPLVLACILGPVLEKSVRQSLRISGGSFSIFFTSPIRKA